MTTATYSKAAPKCPMAQSVRAEPTEVRPRRPEVCDGEIRSH